MAPRTIKLLHVEDDVIQQQMTAQQLATLPQFSFAITYADSEDTAVAEFDQLRQDLVLLDYHLAQGNGLSCLRKLRTMDPIVPIIALSGKATPEIAAELLKAGADNYLSKMELATESLTNCVQEALVRTDAWRRHAPPTGGVAVVELERSARELFREFAAVTRPLLGRLDALEAVARQGNLNVDQFQHIFETVCAGLASESVGSESDIQRLLRPVLLEMVVRLWGQELGLDSSLEKAMCPPAVDGAGPP